MHYIYIITLTRLLNDHKNTHDIVLIINAEPFIAQTYTSFFSISNKILNSSSGKYSISTDLMEFKLDYHFRIIFALILIAY